MADDDDVICITNANSTNGVSTSPRIDIDGLGISTGHNNSNNPAPYYCYHYRAVSGREQGLTLPDTFYTWESNREKTR